MEDSITFWKSEFTRKMSEDKWRKEYMYNVRHMYGQEGCAQELLTLRMPKNNQLSSIFLHTATL